MTLLNLNPSGTLKFTDIYWEGHVDATNPVGNRDLIQIRHPQVTLAVILRITN